MWAELVTLCEKRVQGIVQVVEQLPSKHKALGLVLTTEKERERDMKRKRFASSLSMNMTYGYLSDM
jgi:hypothetical protein